jgi:hypothetical protein
VTCVQHPGHANSILDLSVEVVIVHEDCQPVELHDVGQRSIRGLWAAVIPGDETHDERLMKGPPDEKPVKGRDQVVLFLPDEKGRDQPCRVEIVDDHSLERNYHLDLAEVRTREEVGIPYMGHGESESKIKDRTWSWEPSPFNAEREKEGQ